MFSIWKIMEGWKGSRLESALHVGLFQNMTNSDPTESGGDRGRWARVDIPERDWPEETWRRKSGNRRRHDWGILTIDRDIIGGGWPNEIWQRQTDKRRQEKGRLSIESAIDRKPREICSPDELWQIENHYQRTTYQRRRRAKSFSGRMTVASSKRESDNIPTQ